MLLKALSLQDTKRTVLGEDFIGYFWSRVIYHLSAGHAHWESCPEGSWEPLGGVKVNFKARVGVLAGLGPRVVVWVTCLDLSSQDKRGGGSQKQRDGCPPLLSSPCTGSFIHCLSHTFTPQAPPSAQPNARSLDALETVIALEKVPGSGDG